MGSVSKPCILFQSWFLKNSGFLPDQKSRTLPCAYHSSYPHCISAVEQSGWTEDSSKTQWMLIPATNQKSCDFFANQPKPVPPNFSRLILSMKRQFLFLTIHVNSSGTAKGRCHIRADCPEFICACSQIWKSPENRFAWNCFPELLAFDLNRCQRNKDI